MRDESFILSFFPSQRKKATDRRVIYEFTPSDRFVKCSKKLSLSWHFGDKHVLVQYRETENSRNSRGANSAAITR